MLLVSINLQENKCHPIYSHISGGGTSTFLSYLYKRKVNFRSKHSELPPRRQEGRGNPSVSGCSSQAHIPLPEEREGNYVQELARQVTRIGLMTLVYFIFLIESPKSGKGLILIDLCDNNTKYTGFFPRGTCLWDLFQKLEASDCFLIGLAAEVV